MQVKSLQLKRALCTALLVLLLNMVGMGKMYAQTNLIVNGDFESGNTAFFTDYTLQYLGAVGEGRCCIDTTSTGHGSGSIGWPTILGYGGSGNYMMVNGFGGATNPTKVVWKQTVNVTSNTDYVFTCQVVNLAQSFFGYNPNPAILRLKINGMQVGSNYTLSQDNDWLQWQNTWNSGTATQAVIEIFDVYTGNAGLGDDFGLDAISFTPNEVYSVAAVDDSDISVCEGTPIDIDVLNNDIVQPNANDAVVSIVTQPSHGTATVMTNKKIRYIFTGGNYTTDQLQYRVTNHGVTDDAWVYINTSLLPQVGSISAPPPICVGDALSLIEPSVVPSVVVGQWEMSFTQNGTYQTFDPNNVPLSMNGCWVRYSATNECGEGHSNAVQIFVNYVPTIATITSPQAIYAGNSFNIAVPSIQNNGSAITSQGWQIAAQQNGSYSAFNNNNVPYSYNGYWIRYFAENGCGISYSNSVQITVYQNDNNITFADAYVKAICVVNWDTNGDGELSYDEAAAVTDLDQVFRDNSTITSFDELQYFTGLTSIGGWAFSGCSGLTSLTIPNSVTSLGSWAFGYCSGLMSLTIPNSVTSFGSWAFGYCNGLTSLTIPNSVTSIGNLAFGYCSGLISLELGNSVTTIGDESFIYCSGLEQIIVDEDNSSYDSRENCNAIIETSTNTLITGCKNTIIPNSVTSIGGYAFSGCSGLTSLTIPNSVTLISDYAFRGCSGLTSLDLGNSVTTIGDDAFSYCYGLTSVTIPNSVTSLGSLAFSYCYGLTSLDLGNSVTTIGDYAFGYCSGLSTIIVLAETPPTLGYDVFYNLDTSLPVYVPCSSISDYQSSAGWNIFTNYQPATTCASGEITVTVNPTEGGIVTGIGYYEGGTLCTLTATPNEGYLFLNWSKNGEVVSTNSTYSFIVAGDANLVANFAEEGDACFITFELYDSYGDGYTGNYLVVTDEHGLQQLTVGSGSLAVYTLPFLTGSHITLTWIFGSYPEDCSFTVSYSNGNVIYHGENLNESFSYEFDVDCNSAPIGNIVFADPNVKALCIANWDTDGDGELSYDEAAAVTNLGQTFRGNTAITSFNELQYFTGLSSIGYQAFYNCTGLTSIEIPNSVTSIGAYAFYHCNGLTGNLTIPNSVTSIGDYAFNGCSGFTGGLTIPNSVTSIGQYAFRGCSGFTGDLTIGNSVTSIGRDAFSYCNNFTEVHYNATNCADIPYPFYGFSGAPFTGCGTTLSIGANVERIPSFMFTDAGFTGCLIIPNSVTDIGEGAFRMQHGFETIVVEADNQIYDSRENCNAIIKTSSNELIQGCNNTIILNSVTSIGNYALFGCSGLMGSLVIPNSVAIIGRSAFSGCYNLTGSLTIPNSVTSIGDYAFYECFGFTGSLTIPNSLTAIGECTFEGCRGLTGNLTIPNSVTTIGFAAFCRCNGFTGSLIIPLSVTTIGTEAFYGCSNFGEVMLLGTTPPLLGQQAFDPIFQGKNNGFAVTEYPIYVPYESLNDYKTATNWSDYEDRIFPMTYETISGYGEGEGNWRFIASPLAENIDPTTVNNMISETAYDLYEFDQSATDGEWQNYKANTEDFVLENGQGYLYANAEDVNIIFKGAFNEEETKEVGLVYDANADFAGWNLVGNPFPVGAYANKSYYTMNEDGTGVEPVAVSTAMAIAPCTGVMVEAEGTGESVIFSKTAPEMAANQGNVQIVLSQVVDRGGVSTGSTTAVDKAIVSFNIGDQLEKFVFNKGNASLSIPQGGKDFAIVCAEKQGEMPLNFKATKDGLYTLNVNVENAELEYLHLIDNLTGEEIDLLAMPNYTFEAKTSDYASRFRLVFNANEMDGSSIGSGIFAFISNGNIIVTGAEADAVLQIVDEMGRVLVSYKGDAMNHVSTSGMTPSVYVLRLIQGENMKTQKIVVW